MCCILPDRSYYLRLWRKLIRVLSTVDRGGVPRPISSRSEGEDKWWMPT
jgi:hypothetical protein